MKTKLSFLDDVFRRRLAKTTEYPVRELEQLIGSNALPHNTDLACMIRKGAPPPLWGREALCELCSGDIHYVISVVGDMVRASGGPDALAKETKPIKIAQAIQNKAIRQAAGSFLKNLRGIPRFGEQLVWIVEAFGNVANSHLKFVDSKDEERNPPKQASRIEGSERWTLSKEAQEVYDELLRYSVFIEDYRGKSRRGHVVPRLYLRRFLIPHFNLTFSKRDKIELATGEIEQFLLRPRDFEKERRLQSATTDNQKTLDFDLEES